MVKSSLTGNGKILGLMVMNFMMKKVQLSTKLDTHELSHPGGVKNPTWDRYDSTKVYNSPDGLPFYYNCQTV